MKNQWRTIQKAKIMNIQTKSNRNHSNLQFAGQHFWQIYTEKRDNFERID